MPGEPPPPDPREQSSWGGHCRWLRRRARLCPLDRSCRTHPCLQVWEINQLNPVLFGNKPNSAKGLICYTRKIVPSAKFVYLNLHTFPCEESSKWHHKPNSVAGRFTRLFPPWQQQPPPDGPAFETLRREFIVAASRGICYRAESHHEPCAGGFGYLSIRGHRSIVRCVLDEDGSVSVSLYQPGRDWSQGK